MADLKDLLLQTQELRKKEQQIKDEIKLKRLSITKEYTSGLSETDKARQIKDAETSLISIELDTVKAKNEFKAKLQALKERKDTVKDLLEFIGYKQAHSSPRGRDSYIFEQTNKGDNACFKRVDVCDITFKVVDGWERTLKLELAKFGINGDKTDRRADNIVWRMQQHITAERALSKAEKESKSKEAESKEAESKELKSKK